MTAFKKNKSSLIELADDIYEEYPALGSFVLAIVGEAWLSGDERLCYLAAGVAVTLHTVVKAAEEE